LAQAINMRVMFVACLLIATSFTAGCLDFNQSSTPSTNIPGCYEGQPDEIPEECEIDIIQENNTGAEGNSTDTSGDNQTSSGNNTDLGNQTQTPEVGPWEGEQIFQVNALARSLGGNWSEWNLYDHFNQSWNGTISGSENGSDENWVLIEFLSTDCVHCWNAADEMSKFYQNYSSQIDILSFAVNFSSNDYFNASQDEVAAFQDMTTHSGCRGNSYDCSTRPGEPHDWLYVDDRNQSAMFDFEARGTPMFVIIQPNGIVAWHQYQHSGEGDDDDENIIEALERFFGPMQ
jgi:hypothetical protein